MSVVVVANQGGGTLSPKDPAGAQFYYWDFTAWLGPNETITSAVVTSTNKVDLTDNSIAMVSGPAIILSGGKVVKQMIAAGYAGDCYTLTAKATTIDSITGLSQTFPLSATLEVETVYGVTA